MFQTVSRGPGDIFPTQKVFAYNRTGATLERGQIGMLDLSGTQGETATTAVAGAETYALGNVTPVVQAQADLGYPIVVAEDRLLDNECGWFILQGDNVEVATLDDDVSTTDVDLGDLVTVLVSESAVAIQAQAAGTKRVLGIAREDTAADSTNTDRLINASSHRRRMLWWGGDPGKGIVAF